MKISVSLSKPSNQLTLIHHVEEEQLDNYDLDKFLIFFNLHEELLDIIFGEFLPNYKIVLPMFSFGATFKPMKELGLFQLYLDRNFCIDGLKTIKYHPELLKLTSLNYSQLNFSKKRISLNVDMTVYDKREDFEVSDEEDDDSSRAQKQFECRIFEENGHPSEEVMFAWFKEL